MLFRSKLVKDWEPSRGNVTGVSDLLALDKQMDLVKQVVPNAKRVGVVYNQIGRASCRERVYVLV